MRDCQLNTVQFGAVCVYVLSIENDTAQNLDIGERYCEA